VWERGRVQRDSHWGSQVEFLGRGGEEGQWPGAMTINAMAAGGFKAFKKRGLDGGVTVGN
jgi:hypothetical protein